MGILRLITTDRFDCFLHGAKLRSLKLMNINPFCHPVTPDGSSAAKFLLKPTKRKYNTCFKSTISNGHSRCIPVNKLGEKKSSLIIFPRQYALQKKNHPQNCKITWNSSVLTDLHCPFDCTAQSSILYNGSISLVLLSGILWNDLGSSSFPLFRSG